MGNEQHIGIKQANTSIVYLVLKVCYYTQLEEMQRNWWKEFISQMGYVQRAKF